MMSGRRSLIGGDQGSAQWSEMAAGVGLTLLFHGLILATALLSGFCTGSQLPDEEDDDALELVFEDVELLALGEEPDPHMMPRLTGDEGTPAPAEEVVDLVDDQEREEPPPPESELDPEELERQRQADEQRRREEAARREEEARQRAAEERRRRMQEATGRFQQEGPGDEAPHGSPDGVAGGTTTDADRADMMMTYQARLLREIERFWEVPATISDGELRSLAGRVRVFVNINSQGHVQDYEFRTRSGNEQFDDSIERVLRQFSASQGGNRLPLPEQPQIREQIVERGLLLTNWENVQRR